jgi:hypothetical protein
LDYAHLHKTIPVVEQQTVQYAKAMAIVLVPHDRPFQPQPTRLDRQRSPSHDRGVSQWPRPTPQKAEKSKNMQAVFYTSHGKAADVLQVVDVAIPTPGPGEVLVKLYVSGINPSDCKARALDPALFQVHLNSLCSKIIFLRICCEI